jgi:hypothetical protein
MKLKILFERICEVLVVGMSIAGLGVAVFLIPIELISSIFHFGFYTTLWLHKAVALLFFCLGVISEAAPAKIIIESINYMRCKRQ